MISLKGIDYLSISQWLWEFQKKSKCLEIPPESAQCIGIYEDNTLIGYFIIQGFNHTDIEINQGYLIPKYRHFGYPKESMRLLEVACKNMGYKKMLLGTHNRFRSYLKFAKSLGYTPEHLTFSKNLGE